jgi:predicted DCC family thiol-disulfide oxidoreductase YuxK
MAALFLLLGLLKTKVLRGAMNDKHLVLWDGDCGFCRRCVAYLMRRDQRHRFAAMPYQNAPDSLLSPRVRAACAHSVHLKRRDGRLLKAGRAVLFALEKTAASRLEAALWRLLRQMPFIFPIEIGYAYVASHRLLISKYFFRAE